MEACRDNVQTHWSFQGLADYTLAWSSQTSSSIQGLVITSNMALKVPRTQTLCLAHQVSINKHSTIRPQDLDGRASSSTSNRSLRLRAGRPPRLSCCLDSPIAHLPGRPGLHPDPKLGSDWAAACQKRPDTSLSKQLWVAGARRTCPACLMQLCALYRCLGGSVLWERCFLGGRLSWWWER